MTPRKILHNAHAHVTTIMPLTHEGPMDVWWNARITSWAENLRPWMRENLPNFVGRFLDLADEPPWREIPNVPGRLFVGRGLADARQTDRETVLLRLEQLEGYLQHLIEVTPARLADHLEKKLAELPEALEDPTAQWDPQIGPWAAGAATHLLQFQGAAQAGFAELAKAPIWYSDQYALEFDEPSLDEIVENRARATTQLAKIRSFLTALVEQGEPAGPKPGLVPVSPSVVTHNMTINQGSGSMAVTGEMNKVASRAPS